MKFLTKLVLILVLILGVMAFQNIDYVNEIVTEKISEVYSGPVPEGFDEDYFRETGITKPLEDNG